MSKRQVTTTILCEDLQQLVFARRFLIKLGIHPRKIRQSLLPSGVGSGEQYVRQCYPNEVSAYRRQSSYRNVCLIVLIDADLKTVTDRLRQLDDALEEENLEKRQEKERIAIFVPKRNIETWIHYLQGEEVDEKTAYPKFAREGDCQPVVEALADRCDSGLEETAPPSLRMACRELQRILPL
jgi:hypothetical protein